MTFKERITKGLDGSYQGLANGFSRINKYIFGIQRGCYTVLGGLSGAAKTTFLDYILLEAIKDAKLKNIPINIFYYCLEINEETKKANWLSTLIYQKYKIVVEPEKIKGLGDYRLIKDEQLLVDDLLPELEEIWSKINWVFNSINPTGLYFECWKFMEKRGKFQYIDYVTEKGEKKQRIDKFIADNPNEYNIIAADHLALFSRERDYTLKENIDKISEYAVSLRNTFNMTIFFLQQFNQTLNSVDRQKFKGVDLSPQQNDFKDSSNPYQDSDIALGLLNAYKMGMEECLEYNINKSPLGLKHRFRMLKIIKNRLSRDDIAIGLFFHPEAGRFKEFPPVEEMTNDKYEQIKKNFP